MGPLIFGGLPPNPLLLLDSAPIVYSLERHPQHAPRFDPVFAAFDDARLRLAVTTITISEVLAGPMRVNDEALARRYRTQLEEFRVIALDADIAERAARLRAELRLKPPDAVVAASAIAINADALVTHDRDFSRLRSLRVIS